MGRKQKPKRKQPKKPVAELRIDFGCGPHKRDGFIGVDAVEFAGVDLVMDVRCDRWPWEDGSVDEASAAHFVEHLTAVERVRFFNDLHRVLKPGAKFHMITPHWASNRAYGDPTHQWPPVSEMAFYYLNREWRMLNAPHTDAGAWPDGFACDFDFSYGYALRQDLLVRSEQFKQDALMNYKEAAQDMVATLIKR